VNRGHKLGPQHHRAIAPKSHRRPPTTRRAMHRPDENRVDQAFGRRRRDGRHAGKRPVALASASDSQSHVACLQDGSRRLRAFLVIAAHTGLRISEVLSLQWSSINVSTRSISVIGKGGKLRAVFLTPTLQKELDTWRRQQAKQRLASRWWDTEHERIITTEIGTKMDPLYWRRKHFKPLTDRIAPGATPHSLMHAFATIMLEEGVPLRVVSEQMSHSSTRITEQVYSHVTARLQREAGAAVERVLGM
jgi:integrase